MSACQTDVEGKAYMLSADRTRLSGIHGIHVAAPRKKKSILMKTS